LMLLTLCSQLSASRQPAEALTVHSTAVSAEPREWRLAGLHATRPKAAPLDVRFGQSLSGAVLSETSIKRRGKCAHIVPNLPQRW
jgi:hypothetical protein